MQQTKRFLRIAGWTLWMAMGMAVSAHWISNSKSLEETNDDPRFTGVSTRMEPTNLNVSRRHFDSSARSAWHSHDHGQLLFAEEGRARTQRREPGGRRRGSPPPGRPRRRGIEREP